MKKILFVVTAFCLLNVNAQEKKDKPIQGWKKGGNISFLFNQSSFNNWLAGGSNNISGNIGLNYDMNYLKGTLTWDNKIIASYGLTKIKDEPFRKTDDRLEFNSLFGEKAKGNWFYSGFLNFKTQMGARLSDKGKESSRFFSPAYLQFGPGMLWKKNDNLKVNIAPATSKFIFVSREFTKNLNSDESFFGVTRGKTLRYEIGASLSAYYKLNIMKNVSLQNILNLYSNYMQNPENIDIDYTLNVVMKINKYLSANLSLQAIYDDNASKNIQIREVFGLGINYGI